MTATRRLRVFLSYAHADSAQVRELYKNLINRGFEVWFDEESLIPGQEWKSEIEKALGRSDVIVVCVSDHAVGREGFVQREFKFALDKALEMTEESIFLIPVRLNHCEVPPGLGRYHWVDLFGENGLNRLVKALHIRLEQIIEREAGKEVAAKPQKNIIFPYWYWLLTYAPYLVGCIAYFVADFFAGFPTFSTTSLIAIMTTTTVSFIQWLILRPHFKKAIRWILFSTFLSSYIFLVHAIILNLQSGAYRYTQNSDEILENWLFFRISFWLILIVWAAVNSYMGYLLHKDNKKIRQFFGEDGLSISFWNQWGLASLIGAPVSAILIFSTQIFSLDLSNEALLRSLIGLGIGFSQWLLLRKYFDAVWWIFANLIAGLFFGLALNTETIMKGYLVDEIILFIWFMINSLGGPFLAWSSQRNRLTATMTAKNW